MNIFLELANHNFCVDTKHYCVTATGICVSCAVWNHGDDDGGVFCVLSQCYADSDAQEVAGISHYFKIWTVCWFLYCMRRRRVGL